MSSTEITGGTLEGQEVTLRVHADDRTGVDGYISVLLEADTPKPLELVLTPPEVTALIAALATALGESEPVSSYKSPER